MAGPTWINWVWWLTGGVLALIGAALPWWSLFSNRSRGRRRCPRCWYDMSASPGLTCSECGKTVARERQLFKTRCRWRWAMVGLLLTLITPAIYSYLQFHERGWYWLLPKYRVASETVINGWQVQRLTHRDPEDWGEAVRIRRNGTTAWLLESAHVDLGAMNAAEDTGTPIGFGEDMTGDGIPDLVVSEYTGGAHCCTIYHILRLGAETIVEASVINAEHGGVKFVDLDGDGFPEAETNDWTFAYWHECFADSPRPRVVLKWRGDGFALAPDLMRNAPYSEQDLEGEVNLLRQDKRWRNVEWPEGAPPTRLWVIMLNLIYAGRSDLAWRFLEDAWPEHRPGRMLFLVDFVAKLSSSPYWVGLRGMMDPPADDDR